MSRHRSSSLVLALLLALSPLQAGQLYYSAYNIAAAQVPSTQTDFPVLVSVTDARLKSTGNGGHVASTSGFDIRPYTDTTLGTAITGFELVKYVATTGELEMWVKVSSLTSSSTPFVLGYGDTTLTTDGSSTTTWSNSFESVYHLKDGTTLAVTDSTSNARTLTNTNTVTATTGQIDGAGGFLSASSQHLDVSTGSLNPSALTFSAWVKATSFPNAYNSVVTLVKTGPTKADEILVKSTGKLTCFVDATTSRVYDGTGSNTLSTGTWYLLHMTYNASAGLVGYVNASSDGTVAANGGANVGTGASIGISNDAGTAGRFWNGSLDEVRLANVARSADWITTEYNNQNAPGTFASLGSEVAVTATQAGWFIFMNP